MYERATRGSRKVRELSRILESFFDDDYFRMLRTPSSQLFKLFFSAPVRGGAVSELIRATEVPLHLLLWKTLTNGTPTDPNDRMS